MMLICWDAVPNPAKSAVFGNREFFEKSSTKNFCFCLRANFVQNKNAGKSRHSHYRLYLKFGGWAAPILMPAITKGGQRTKQVCGPRATASKRDTVPERFYL